MQVLFKPAEVEVEVSNQPLGGPTHTEREGERINNSTGQGKQGGRVAAFVFARAGTTTTY